MSQLEQARKRIVSPELESVARCESVAIDVLMAAMAAGHIVIPANRNHNGLTPCGIGKGLRTKVNANIGTSSDFGDVHTELEKLRVAISAGADTVMDLSTGGDIGAVRRALIAECPLPFGTVPVYQAGIEAISKRGAITRMTEEDLFQVIETQAREGVDFMTLHCGVTLETVSHLQKHPRLASVVSRGGAFMLGWMAQNERENPLYEHFDRLLDIAKEYDVTLSLGDGLRPGSIFDASDAAQVAELIVLGELVKQARAAGVQVMVEGPGHVPLDQIEANIQMEKVLCHGAPFYVLGPLVTDVAAGYDHIAGAIGGAVAAMAGADFLCYVTPAEHLSLPDVEDVKQGIIASRIAAHAADLVKMVPGEKDRDWHMTVARRKLDWEAQARLSFDPEKSTQVHKRMPSRSRACSMCGEFCAMDLAAKFLGNTDDAEGLPERCLFD